MVNVVEVYIYFMMIIPLLVPKSASCNSTFKLKRGLSFARLLMIVSYCILVRRCYELFCRLFCPEEQQLSEHEREVAFDYAFTHSLYYLAQVYNTQGESKKAAVYCHTTLLRQLDTGKYEPVDWAVNCATLSQYYLTAGNYNMARHCLGLFIC